MNNDLEKIAQWVIDNRYPKDENNKLSDFELYNILIDKLKQLPTKQNSVNDCSCDNEHVCGICHKGKGYEVIDGKLTKINTKNEEDINSDIKDIICHYLPSLSTLGEKAWFEKGIRQGLSMQQSNKDNIKEEWLLEPLRNFIRSRHLTSEWEHFLNEYVSQPNQENIEKCNGNCGMNYCDENGCVERKRVLVDPIDKSLNKEVELKEIISKLKNNNMIIDYYDIVDSIKENNTPLKSELFSKINECHNTHGNENILAEEMIEICENYLNKLTQ